MSRDATSFNREADTASPLIRAIALPEVILRLNITVSSSVSMPSCRIASRTFGFSTEKTSSTSAVSSLSRSSSFGTFSPSANATEPMMMDLPAPVSPVKILSPSLNSTSVSVIRARFFTCRFCNIHSPSTFPKHFYYCSTIFRSFFMMCTASSDVRITHRIVSSPQVSRQSPAYAWHLLQPQRSRHTGHGFDHNNIFRSIHGQKSFPENPCIFFHHIGIRVRNHRIFLSAVVGRNLCQLQFTDITGYGCLG